ncbi:Fatty-acid amide hydrolase 1 [Trichostrongylus colubriformis]|uniref:Fatty-acid amide hydrolase 1 n=1 Tax=Trichostrongylus colubriformis TaxID=6319 RepID=A0AAN8J2D5_TRICO
MGNVLPWGAQANCRRAIERNEKSRSQGFGDFESRVATDSNEELERRKQILSWPLMELRDRLQRDQLTATQALEAYVWKAMQLQERNNCCIEVIREAFDTAAEMDRLWSGAVEKPPLYGIPFSVKGNFYMPGYDCTLGLAKFLEQPRLDECTMVTHLRNLGAVPFVITNVPQALLSFVCSNSVYGTTTNPLDVTRSPGGSSGGEGALVAGGGTPFGIGSDLAGSLRIPAAFCGFVTLKPCQERLVVKNTHGGVPGRGRLGLSFGFFTHSVEEQVELLQMIVGSPEYIRLVPTSVSAPINKEEINRKDKLRIGYYDDDGFCPAVPCVKRALLDTVERLKAEGHELIRFKIPNIDEMVQLLYKLLMPDGGRYVLSLYDNDIVDPYLKEFVTLLKVPHSLRYLASCILHSISPQLSALCTAYVSNLEDLRYTQEQCDAYKDKFIDYWKSLGIDALICPTFPVPAVPHRFPSRMSSAATYTGLYNLLDFPAGAVPAGKVTSEDDQDLLDESKYPVGYNVALRYIREASMNSVGLPLSVQVVTLPYEEEKCLRVMGEVERVWKDPADSESFASVSQ